MTDLAERLRHRALARTATGAKNAKADAALDNEAAAEIERLREALERARWYVEAYDTPEHNPEQQAALTAIDAALSTGAAHE